MRERVLIAVGGNALYDTEHGNNLSPFKVAEVCAHILEVYESGYQPIITFGNGPQVGNLLDMAETSARLFAEPVSLDDCVSWTQGEIGYEIAHELNRRFMKKADANHPAPLVVAVNTMVEVDAKDPAFQKPTKPVGKFITAEQADKLYEERGWMIGPDANRGYRRMVPSPRPKRIVEADAIGTLINSGFIVLCCGGGGIPVANVNGNWSGMEAVIDKDFTSCLLAETLNIENIVICTEVDYVYLNFGEPHQKALERLSLGEAEQYMAEGHFAAGSMGPKVAGLIEFVRAGGKRAIITSLGNLKQGLDGKIGTEIYAGN